MSAFEAAMREMRSVGEGEVEGGWHMDHGSWWFETKALTSQYRTVRYCTVQYRTIQHDTIRTIRHYTTLNYAILYHTTLSNTIVMYATQHLAHTTHYTQHTTTPHHILSVRESCDSTLHYTIQCYTTRHYSILFMSYDRVLRPSLVIREEGGGWRIGGGRRWQQHNTTQHHRTQCNKRQDKTALDPSLLMLLAHSNSIRNRVNSLSSTTLYSTQLNSTERQLKSINENTFIHSFSAKTLRHDSTLARIHTHTRTDTRYNTRQYKTMQYNAILSSRIR